MDPRECCSYSDLSSCDTSSSIFQKAIYPPSYYSAPAITYLGLAIVYMLMMIPACSNIKNLIRYWETLKIKQYLVINVFVLIVLVAKIGYFLDGPLQLFSCSIQIPVYVDHTVEMVAIWSINLSYICSSYLWFKMILMYRDEEEFARKAKLAKTLFTLDGTLVSAICIMEIVFLMKNDQDFLNMFSIFSSAMNSTNSLVFAITCIKLAKLKKSCLHIPKRVKLLRALVIMVAVAAFFEVLNACIWYIDNEWQIRFNLITYCNRNFAWSAYLIFLFMIANIIPITFFLIIFRVHKRSREADSNEGELLEESRTRAPLDYQAEAEI